MYAVYEIMVERLGALLDALDGVWSEELGEVNARLREMGMEEIVVGARRVAMGDWEGDPDVTLGWGMWDGEGDGVRAVLRWSGVGEILPGEVGVGVVS